VNTAGFLQSTAEESGEESVEKVTNRVDVVSSYGIVGNSDDVKSLNMTVRLAAGSDNVDLEDATINYQSESKVVTLEQGGTANAGFFKVSPVKDDDTSSPILNDRGDRFEISIDAIDTEGGPGLAPGSEVKLEISTKTGDTTVVLLTTPDTYSGKSSGEPVSL
jgi:flagellin FlaB